jgi:2-dehydro-3-deoxyphosphogluconate aldolase/(4S)-4-hydroxy-2-oxoglutarate aldolase
MRIEHICRQGPVIPVIVIDSLDQAVPLAETLVEAGLRVLEITLRTPVALAAIEKIAVAVPQAILGAGTIRSAQDITTARAAGAVFGVSPGTPPDLREAILADGLPFLPGCSTVTEAMSLRSAGFPVVKLFPAEAVGGAPLLRALQSPFPDISFCPTGGLTAENACDYLALANVLCVGGSWMIPRDSLYKNDWAVVAKLAKIASQLSRSISAGGAV